MLGFFPQVYPDELLYSVLARFSDRLKYPSRKAVLQELFGTINATAVIDFPSRLDSLVKRFPACSLLTVDRLINSHTLYPFFSAFLSYKQAKLLYGDMRVSSGPAAHMRSGVMASSIPVTSHLRFCTVCKKEDEARYGEAYWHRLHQLTGVEVCQRHEVFLNNSNVAFRAGRNNLVFISASQAMWENPVRSIDIKNRDHQVLIKIVKDAAWLFEHPFGGTSLEALRLRYLRLLIDRGLATYTGSICVRKLLDEFKSFYSSSLLKLLRCEFTGSDQVKTNWLLRLARPPKHAQHPLYHLLLMQFLDCNAEEFFQVPGELRLFGEKPWPCLNPAAKHYRQPVIKKFRMGRRLRGGRPTGIFECACGFVFARTGPDSSSEDKYRVGKVISFGATWEAKLEELWADHSLSLSEVGRRLGVDPLTVRRHASRLSLTASRSVSKTKPLSPTARLKSNSKEVEEGKRRTHRSTWLSALKKNPQITMKALRKKLPQAYAWLLQYDPEWLKRHKPPILRRTQTALCIDWQKRDAEYAATVRAAATHIKNIRGRPVRVTKTAIGRHIGAVSLLRQKLYKMPLTSQFLASVVETREEYAVRRVRWAANCYLHDGILPRPWQLLLKANVYSLRKLPEIIHIIEATLNELVGVLSISKSSAA